MVGTLVYLGMSQFWLHFQYRRALSAALYAECTGAWLGVADKNLSRNEYFKSRRQNFTKRQKKIENEKAKNRMRKMRSLKTDKQKGADKLNNRKKSYLQRLLKKESLEFTENLDIEQYNFDIYERSITTYNCSNCHTKRLISSLSFTACSFCRKFEKVNNLNPGPIPLELQDLSFVARQLISRIHPVVSLYKIKNCQYGYSGNVINFPQDVQELVDILPINLSDLKSIITIRLDNSNGYSDFQVNRNKNGNVYKLMNGYDKILATENKDDTENDYSDSDSYDSDDEFDLELINDLHDEINSEEEFNEITYTDLPNIKTFTQNDQINSNLNGSVYIWPTIGVTPINEFSSPGYISMAFPTLFPYGTGDYSMIDSKHLKLTDYVDYLMFYEDGRFARDERFRYFIMNSLMRWNSLKLGNIFIEKNEIFSNMTVLQLQEYIKQNPSIANKIMFYANKIPKTCGGTPVRRYPPEYN
ncbi:3-phosphoshikimate 1-carboxyvinyltransferase [Frankliniella fusca]|uniref:3-phosphoshikimate 1-carboxyvinyltransferase n=1 Tax=Frankliniella fusca TaxID=407009 RepID=A0AAE1H9U1_9NEOP|nr:3-phosphoshikimate 1-carboxyvinyltransferase [Frankliniella fusca]